MPHIPSRLDVDARVWRVFWSKPLEVAADVTTPKLLHAPAYLLLIVLP